MKMRSYPVCPHCGSWTIVERGVVGEWNDETQRWIYGAGDDGVYSCDSCDEESPAPRWIAVPVAQMEIDAIYRRIVEARLSVDRADDPDRAAVCRANAETLSKERDKAVAHNHNATRDAAWMAGKNQRARAA